MHKLNKLVAKVQKETELIPELKNRIGSECIKPMRLMIESLVTVRQMSGVLHEFYHKVQADKE